MGETGLKTGWVRCLHGERVEDTTPHLTPIYVQNFTIFDAKGPGAFLWFILVNMCRKLVFSELVYVALKYVARENPCAAAFIPQYMIFFALDQLHVTYLARGLSSNNGLTTAR